MNIYLLESILMKNNSGPLKLKLKIPICRLLISMRIKEK